MYELEALGATLAMMARAFWKLVVIVWARICKIIKKA